MNKRKRVTRGYQSYLFFILPGSIMNFGFLDTNQTQGRKFKGKLNKLFILIAFYHYE